MQAAVVILNWNGKFFLEKFLPGVLRHSFQVAEIIVADNNSSDDSVALLREKFPEVKIILNRSNLGFAGGYNEALKQVKSEYYILLNSDVEVTENWIQPVIELMEKDKRIAACQPKIRSYKQRNEFEYAGASGGFIDKYGYPFCRGRIFSSLETDNGQYDDIKEIFWATGACLFVRSVIFHDLGGFDETFFAHMEEIDLCWRIHRSGNKIMCCPASTVYHIGGGTLPKNNPRKTYLNFRNNLMMIYKNAERKDLFSILLFRTFFDFIAAVLFLFTNGWPDCSAVLKAHVHFHKKKKNLDKGSAIMTDHAVKLIYPKSVLFGYFIFRKKKFSELGYYTEDNIQ
jgi:GT2 family glycosyltransferase